MPGVVAHAFNLSLRRQSKQALLSSPVYSNTHSTVSKYFLSAFYILSPQRYKPLNSLVDAQSRLSFTSLLAHWSPSHEG